MNFTNEPSSLRFPDLPVYRGYSAPSRIEAEVFDLEVEGRFRPSSMGHTSEHVPTLSTRRSTEPIFSLTATG
jgi:aminoglycoside N3'-acetyltransferase